MDKPIRDPNEDKDLDRYLRGELGAEEKRRFILRSFQDPDLFDIVMTRSLLSEAGESEKAPSRRRRWIFLAAGMAAALAVAAVYFQSPRIQPVGQKPANVPSAAVTSIPGVLPALSFDQNDRGRLVLASLLSADPSEIPRFRGNKIVSAEPKEQGEVLAIENEEATISLGSMDGLQDGTEVEFTPGKITGKAVTVFRNESRIRLPGGHGVARGGAVLLPASVHLAALLEWTEVLLAGRDSKRAKRAATNARNFAVTHRLEESRAWRNIAVAEVQVGERRLAAEHLSLAIQNLPGNAPARESMALLEALAAASLLAGDTSAAARALSDQQGILLNDPAAQARFWNNRGVLAEMRREGPAAAEYYERSKAIARNSAVDENLSRYRRTAR